MSFRHWQIFEANHAISVRNSASAPFETCKFLIMRWKRFLICVGATNNFRTKMKSFSSSLFNINHEIVKPLFQITLICIENDGAIFYLSYDLSNQMMVFSLTNQMSEIKTLPALNFLIISIANLKCVFRWVSYIKYQTRGHPCIWIRSGEHNSWLVSPIFDEHHVIFCIFIENIMNRGNRKSEKLQKYQKNK